MITEILDCNNDISESNFNEEGKLDFIEWSMYFVIDFINTCK